MTGIWPDTSADGVPVALSARDHRLLADHFGVSERGLGIRDLWRERARGW